MTLGKIPRHKYVAKLDGAVVKARNIPDLVTGILALGGAGPGSVSLARETASGFRPLRKREHDEILSRMVRIESES